MIRRHIIFIALAGWIAPAYAQEAPSPDSKKPLTAQEAPSYHTIVLQGLNKVTGHTSKLEAPVGAAMRFGTLEIIARRCWKSAPEERPENAALLDVSELRAGEPPQRIFLGWMFSSSPGLSSLEHAVYDLTVLACQANESPDK